MRNVFSTWTSEQPSALKRTSLLFSAEYRYEGFGVFGDVGMVHAADGWTSLEDFRGIRRDRMVAQSAIRRPAGDDYQGGYDVIEGYAAPDRTAPASV